MMSNLAWRTRQAARQATDVFIGFRRQSMI
jgi:hypothetical protein